LIPQLQEAIDSGRHSQGNSGPGIEINLHYFPKARFTGLYVKELLFDQERMKTLWEAGEKGEKDTSVDKLLEEAPITIPISILKQILKQQ
jgi:hypothetical protein